MRAAFGGTPYAIGRQMSGKGGWFHVRCIRFGLLAASHERREDEKIMRLQNIIVADKPSKPVKV